MAYILLIVPLNPNQSINQSPAHAYTLAALDTSITTSDSVVTFLSCIRGRGFPGASELLVGKTGYIVHV